MKEMKNANWKRNELEFVQRGDNVGDAVEESQCLVEVKEKW